MRKSCTVNRLLMATVLSAVLLATQSLSAQCSQANSSARANSTALRRQASFSPSFNPINNVSALVVQNQLAQQQYVLAQRQRYLQALAFQRMQMQQAQQQARLNQVNRQQSTSEVASVANASPPENRTATRQDRLREANAKRAYRLAVAAQANRSYGSAEQQYRRVVRILGPDAKLSQQATSSLEDLAELRRTNSTPTVVAQLR